MGNYKTIDFENWNRKDAFNFFREYQNPFFNITANVDVTHLQWHCKQYSQSFFLASLHAILKCMNSIEQFRYRVVGKEVVIFESLDVGATYLNDDHSFAFLMYPYHERLDDFIHSAKEVMESHRTNPVFNPNTRENVVYFSSIPWISYTHISHAQKEDKNDFIPRLSVGKYFKQGDRYLMPFSVQVHHSLCDGYHVGLLFEAVQNAFDSI